MVLGCWATIATLAAASADKLPPLPAVAWGAGVLAGPALALFLCRRLTAWSEAAQLALRRMRDDPGPIDLPDCPDPLFGRIHDACLDLGATQQRRRVGAGLDERASPAALAALATGDIRWSNGWARCRLPLIVSEPADEEEAYRDLEAFKKNVGSQLGLLRAGGAILDGHRWGEIVALVPPGPDAAALACDAALTCIRESQGPRLSIGISMVEVGMGELIEGGLTVFGKETEQARLLARAARLLGAPVVADDAIRLGAEAKFRWRRLGRFRFAWRKMEIFSFATNEGTPPATQLELAQLHASGLALLEARDWSAASDRFKSCLRLAPSDGPARVCLNFAQRFRNNPPPRAWDGALVLGLEA